MQVHSCQMQHSLTRWLWLEDFPRVWPKLSLDCSAIRLLSNLFLSPSPAPARSALGSTNFPPSQLHTFYSSKHVTWSMSKARAGKLTSLHRDAMSGMQMCNAPIGEWKVGTNCSIYYSKKNEGAMFKKERQLLKSVVSRIQKHPQDSHLLIYTPWSIPCPLSAVRTFECDGISFPWLGC